MVQVITKTVYRAGKREYDTIGEALEAEARDKLERLVKKDSNKYDPGTLRAYEAFGRLLENPHAARQVFDEYIKALEDA